MAKKSSTTRVHQLAKELGVSSKDVVAKCQAEGIPNITNHMSTVSLGLQATIREWFGDGAAEESTRTATAVQTVAPVDVTRARAKARKKPATKKTSRKSTQKGAGDDAKATTATGDKAAKTDARTKVAPQPQTESKAPEAQAKSKTAETEAKAKQAETIDEEQAAAAKESAEPTAEAPTAPEAKKDTTEAPLDDKAAGDAGKGDDAQAAEKKQAGSPQMNIPKRPDKISPAGPRLSQPEKINLSGPKVIRVETPDTLPPPRPKGGPRTGAPAGRGPRAGRGAGMAPGQEPPEFTRGGAGAGGRSASRRNKRRSASAGESPGRSGRSSTSGGDRFNWREQDLLERERRLNRAGGFFKAARRDNLKRSTGTGGQRASTAAQSGGVVKVEEPITVKSLSAATGIKAADILRKLFLSGQRVTINSTIDAETATEIMLEYDIELEVTEQQTAEEQIQAQFKERKMRDERRRAPVVTILGHVDHGKTSLLDRIRNANVAEGEAGGITQATSAFRVPVKVGESDHMVTFIDTPGHEAFTEMRARGAKVTDIVVLVVAADDGVMPQTIESINHAKAAGVPIVVALNKIDKPEATDSNIQRILGQLAEHDLNPVDWGGQTEVVRTSALKGEGIQDLLEVLDFQAELLELKADFGGPAEGSVIEAEMQEGRGPVAKILVQQGQMKKGDFIVVGRAYGRVRDIVNDRNERIEEAGPSTPVAISGIDEVPDAGDKFYVVDSLKAAEAAAEERRFADRKRHLTTEKVTLDNIFRKLSEQGRKELPVILKADVQGSVDTIRVTLSKISTDEVTVSVKHAAVGGINESDVSLAEAAGAIVLGFNVTASAAARRAAEERRVDLRFYDVIYDIIDDVKKAAEGLLDPELKLEVLGHAEVRDVFKVSKVGMIAGCYVTDGVIERNAQIRVTRDDIVIEKDRRLKELKRFKDDVKEVRAGQECGMNIEGYDDIRVGDVLECYKTLEVRRSL